MSHLYETVVYNKGNYEEGVSYVENGMAIAVSSPKNNLPGANPEQFIGLAWATCLNATIRSILDKRDITNPSYVKVQVKLFKDTPKGLYFELRAFAAIKDMPLEDVLTYAKSADKYCPVSKLMHGNPHVYLEAETYKL